MFVYILHRYWDTPDNEGNEIMSAYYQLENAISDMKADADATKAYYDSNYWDDEMTWEEDREIHLGHSAKGNMLDTIYCWNIEKVEVR